MVSDINLNTRISTGNGNESVQVYKKTLQFVEYLSKSLYYYMNKELFFPALKQAAMSILPYRLYCLIFRLFLPLDNQLGKQLRNLFFWKNFIAKSLNYGSKKIDLYCFCYRQWGKDELWLCARKWLPYFYHKTPFCYNLFGLTLTFSFPIFEQRDKKDRIVYS